MYFGITPAVSNLQIPYCVHTLRKFLKDVQTSAIEVREQIVKKKILH